MTPGGAAVIERTDVERAAARLAGVAHRTPVLRSGTLDRDLSAQVFLKAEHLQRGGAFKFRGAYNAISALPEQARRRGVVAFSSGNHAQAVALAARLHGIDATIVMPDDAPPVKLAATRGYGAEVVTYDRYAEDREAIGAAVAAERGGALIPPYDDPDVMAGQGTAALELVDEVGTLDLLLVPVGGGGLASGCAAAVVDRVGQVVGVEPEPRRVAREALAQRRVVRHEVVRTIADGQQSPTLGAGPLSVLLAHDVEVVGVRERAIVEAMRFLFERCKAVVEPSGATALAAARSGAVDVRGARVGIVLSGGNVGSDRLADLFERRDDRGAAAG